METLICKVNLKTDNKIILLYRHFKGDMSRIDPQCYNYTSYEVLSWDNKKDENNNYDKKFPNLEIKVAKMRN